MSDAEPLISDCSGALQRAQNAWKNETDAPVKTCPNCTRPISDESAGCVLHSLMSALRDRESLDDAELESIHAECDTDALWNAIGEVLDDLETGRYGGDVKARDDDDDDEDNDDDTDDEPDNR